MGLPVLKARHCSGAVKPDIGITANFTALGKTGTVLKEEQEPMEAADNRWCNNGWHLFSLNRTAEEKLPVKAGLDERN